MDTRLSPAEVSARLDELLLIHEGSRAVLGLLLCPERHLDGLLSSLRAQLAALPPESVELKVLRGEGDDARWLGWANHARNLWLRTHRLVLLVVTTPEGLREARRLANDLTVAPDHAAAGLGTTCEGCHTTAGWTPASYVDHATFWPLTA